MNLVALLITPAIVSFSLKGHAVASGLIAAVAVLVIIYALIRSARAGTVIA